MSEYNEAKSILEYPFNTQYILSKKKRLKRQLLSSKQTFINKKIAILGGSTTNDIKLTLELFLLAQGIKPEFYESAYNGFYQEGAFSNPDLINFNPDLIYIHTTNRNVSQYPTLSMNLNEVNNLLKTEINKFISIWENLESTYHCPIIQNNFEMPQYRLMGNKDASDIHGAVNYLTRLNLAFYEYAQTHKNFYICDINYLSADFGLKEWSDPLYWYMYKYALSINAIPTLAFNISNIIKSIFGKNKKGFVIDLDNTLWGGVIGDDGVDGICLGPDEAEGEAYWEFQKYLKAHKQLGIVLTINSKNDYNNAIDGLNHPYSVLKQDDFILIKSNWEPKSVNFIKIANELNLGIDSLVFLDDNPAERGIIEQQLSNVSSPKLSNIQDYIYIIDRSGFFEVTTLSEDDLFRTKMYKDNIERTKIKELFTDYDEYLKFLDMKAEIHQFVPIYIPRITQLINKSNQFNLTTKRYTQNEIEIISSDSSYITAYGKIEDKYGDNGVVSAVIGRIEENICHIDLWLMSCRVLKRNVEYAMMDYFIQECIIKKIKKIMGYYYPTKKNEMVKEFYKIMGFTLITEDLEGNSIWNYLIPKNYQNKNKVINIIR